MAWNFFSHKSWLFKACDPFVASYSTVNQNHSIVYKFQVCVM